MKQQYVIVRGQVFRWEEKAPFVESGISVLGAMEYDFDTKKIRCHECGEWFKSIGSHASKAHGISSRDYKIKHQLRVGCGMISPDAKTKLSANGNRIRPKGSGFGGTTITVEQRKAIQRKAISSKRNVMEMRNEKGLCPAQLAFKIQQIVQTTGKTPTTNDLGPAVAYAIRKDLGSYVKGLVAMGIEPNRKGVRIDKYVLIELLRDFCVLNQRLPKKSDWSTGSLPNFKTYIRAFGSLVEAYKLAGFSLWLNYRRTNGAKALPVPE